MTTKQNLTKRTVNRRRFLTTVGATGVVLGGFTTSVAANNGNGNGNGNGKIPLNNLSVDILVYWSSGEDSSVDDPEDFGYPATPSDLESGLFFPGHDPEEGGLFDFSKFKLTPNGGTLHNSFELFHGAILASKPKSYPLVHQGDGVYESRGQVMNFEALPYEETLFNDPLDIPEPALPPVSILADNSWRVVGADIAKLQTETDGTQTQDAEWGVTRVDIYSHGRGRPEYELSMLYLIWEAKNPDRIDPDPIDLIMDIPPAVGARAQELITMGQLNMGSQPRGR